MADRIITSLDKGLQLLAALNRLDKPITLAELSRRFPWDKSTVYRTLETLRARKFVVQKDAGYVLGSAALDLGRPRSKVEILEEARELMRVAAERTHETAHLATHAGDSMVFIDRCSLGKFTLHTEIGAREPLHCTAVGKAYLISLEPAEQKAALEGMRLENFTKRTLGSKTALSADLAQARDRGYAVDDREYSDDVRCVAVPVIDGIGRFVAALGISGPASRVTIQRMREAGELLKMITFRGLDE